jgi:predicted RNA-binding Zn-ribbon protein involved in translation (DUF1610 family)
MTSDPCPICKNTIFKEVIKGYSPESFERVYVCVECGFQRGY